MDARVFTLLHQLGLSTDDGSALEDEASTWDIHMAASILTSVKKALGFDEAYEAFDSDIIMFTNSVLATLNQIGVGPEAGFQIEDKAATWTDLLGDDPRLNFVQAWVYLKVRLLFDPPATSFAIAAIQKSAEELEVRINVVREVDKWLLTNP